MRSILTAVVLLFFISSISVSQVIIREKVNINPNARVLDYQAPDYTPCGPWIVSHNYYDPWQVVWNGRPLFLDPYQQLFNKQSNSYSYSFSPQHIYDIIITKGEGYCYIYQLGKYDFQTGEIIPGKIVGDTLLNVLGKDLIGAGDWMVSPCGTWEKDSLPKYQLIIDRDTPSGTEIVMTVTSGTNIINYHTLVEIPYMHLDASPSNANVQHYYASDFSMIAYADAACECGGYLPSWIKFTVEIVQGREYGSIYDKYTGQSSIYFYNIESEAGFSGMNLIDRFSFVADGMQPDTNSPGSVKIRFTPSESGLGTAEVNFNVEFNDAPPIVEGLLADVDKPEIQPGDTASLIIKYQYSDGTIIDLPGWRTYEIGLAEGCGAGQILVGDSLGKYFYDVPQPVKFVAADSLVGDSLLVKLKVGLVEADIGVGKMIKMSNSKNSQVKETISKIDSRKLVYQLPEAVEREKPKSNFALTRNELIKIEKQTEINTCFAGEMQIEDNREVKINVIDLKPNEILLGETKYYQVKYSDSLSHKLVIEEVKPGIDGVPTLNGGLASDVWGNNPISIDTGKNYGKRMGVYWEKEKPVWCDTINKGKLATGLIRIVGRYWSKDSTYRIVLIAKANNDSTSIKINVIEPKELGKKHQEENDVNGDTFNVDSLCINNAGKIGIPPQYIKGHIEKETSFKNSFRYEPRLDIKVQNNKSQKKKYLDDYQYYTVTKTSMGTITIPNNHSNVKPISYITSPKRIGDYLIEKIANYIRYPKKDKNGKWLEPYFVGFKKGKPSIILQDEYSKMKDSLSLNDAMKYAIDSLKKWLKTNNFCDGKKYVQSRIFSSYGMLQQVFYFACTDMISGYAISNDKQTPESLNEIEYSIKAYKEKITKKIKNKSFHQWENGFESDWIKILQVYNKNETDYGKKIIGLSKQYLPKQ